MSALLAMRLLWADMVSSISGPAVDISAYSGALFRPIFFSTRQDAVKKRLFSQEKNAIDLSLTGRGIIVKDKVFQNLTPSDLHKHGAKAEDHLHSLPILVRGDVLGASSEISKSQFGKLLKQVTTHISSVSKIFVQDGAIGSPSKCSAKFRVISDCPSATLSLSRNFWKTPDRAVSHDSSHLTVYIATSISQKALEIVGLRSQTSNGVIAADVERSSLILCGKAFADADGLKAALTALSSPVILARGGLPLSARALVFGDSIVLLFASKETITASSIDVDKNLTSADAGVILSSEGVSPLFPTRDAEVPSLLKFPSSLVFAAADSSGVLPRMSKLSPAQAAYHFLAGYHDGKFVPAYLTGPSPISPVDIARALFSHLKGSKVPSFLVNVYLGGKHITGKSLLETVESTLSECIEKRCMGPMLDHKGADLKGKYKGFLSSRFPEIPEEFVF